MANVTANTFAVYQSGDCDRTVLLAVRGTTAGDTVDVAQWLNVVKLAGLVSATGTTIAGFGGPGTGANGGPTLLTIPAGPSQDGVWIIVTGVA